MNLSLKLAQKTGQVMLLWLMAMALTASAFAAVTGKPLTILVSATRRSVVVPRETPKVVFEEKVGDNWIPVGVRYVPFAPKDKTRTIPIEGLTGVTNLRATAYPLGKLPANFMNAPKEFPRKDPSTYYYDGSLHPVGPSFIFDPPAISELESEAWKVDRNQLYFVNAYRGLQVFDITNPVAPIRTGTLNVETPVTEIYPLGPDGNVVGLVGKTKFTIIKTTNGKPTLLSEVALSEKTRITKLVGNRLFLLEKMPQGNQLRTIDLTNPAAPVTQSVIPLNFRPLLQYDSQVQDTATLQVTGDQLLIASTYFHFPNSTYHWGSKIADLHVISLNGAPALMKSIPLGNVLAYPTAMGIVNGAVAAVTAGDTNGNSRSNIAIETYPLTGTSVTQLGYLSLPTMKQSFWAHIAGTKAFVMQTQDNGYYPNVCDAIDLSNPALPVFLNRSATPISFYDARIINDRLLARGYTNGSTTFMLYSLSPTGGMALLSSLAIANVNFYAQADGSFELPYDSGAGVAMVPLDRGMQPVIVSQNGLTAGPLMSTQYSPRHGEILRNYYLAATSQELVIRSRNPNDTDGAKVALNWRTDRTVALGNYLGQVEDQNANTGHAYLRITTALEPNLVLREVDLGPGQICGLTQSGNRLLLAQIEGVYLYGGFYYGGATLRSLVVDCSNPLQITSPTIIPHHMTSSGGSTAINLSRMQGLWVTDKTFVWYQPSAGRNVAQIFPLTIGPGGITALPEMVVTGNSTDRNSSPPIAMNGMLYFSYETETQILLPRPPITYPPYGGGGVIFYGNFYDNWGYYNQPYQIINYSWLQAIDFRPASPVIQRPVNIPGALLNISPADDSNAVLITGPSARNPNFWDQEVELSLYDGIYAYQLDKIFVNGGIPALIVPPPAPVNFGRTTYFGASNGVNSLSFNATTLRFTAPKLWVTGVLPSYLSNAQGTLLAGGYESLKTATINPDGSLLPRGNYTLPASMALKPANVTPTSTGVWFAAGDYGAEFLTWSELGR